MVSWDFIWHRNVRTGSSANPLRHTVHLGVTQTLFLPLNVFSRTLPDSNRFPASLTQKQLKFKATTWAILSHGEMSAQDHSMGNKEMSLTLGCAQRVLDYQLNHTSVILILHHCPLRLASPISESEKVVSLSCYQHHHLQKKWEAVTRSDHHRTCHLPPRPG